MRNEETGVSGAPMQTLQLLGFSFFHAYGLFLDRDRMMYIYLGEIRARLSKRLDGGVFFLGEESIVICIRLGNVTPALVYDIRGKNNDQGTLRVFFSQSVCLNHYPTCTYVHVRARKKEHRNHAALKIRES